MRGYAQKHQVQSAPTKLKLFVGSTSILVVVSVENLNADPEMPATGNGFSVPLIGKFVATMFEMPDTNRSPLLISSKLL
jgi:hypothetical protein